MNLFELTRKLMDIASVSGEEAELCRFLASYIREPGYNVEVQNVVDDRANILVNQGEPAVVVMSTHIDTVPPFIPSSEDAEFIYGRGACDAKGIIAAQIFALRRLREMGFRNVGLLFTVDEEQGSLGAQQANQHPAAAHCRFLINGEPTDNILGVGSKGSLRVRLSTVGRSAHSAYPEHGISAIDALLDVLSDIRKLDWPRDEFFGETTCNIGVIQGGTRPNVISASAQSEIQIRLVTNSTLIKSTLNQVVSGRATIEYMSCAEPVRMEQVEGFSDAVVRFTTDIPYLSRWGRPLLLGPGSILVAHTDREKISKLELTESVELYVKLAMAVLRPLK